MKRIVILFLCMFTAACAPKPISKSHFIHGNSAEPIIKSAHVEVTLNRFEAKAHPDFTKLFWNEAASQAMDEIGTEFVRLAPLFHGIASPQAALDTSKLFATSGKIGKTPDPQTDDYRQQAEFTAVFVPKKNLAGQIVRLEDDRDIASMKDRITVRLFSTQAVTTPAFFLIAERINDNGPDFLKIIGWGEVVQSLKEPDRTGQTAMGALCLGEIQESSKEVQRGDLIFLLEISAAALKPAMLTSAPTAREPDVVIVEPKWEPEPVEPGETK
jgi:hypothetical protein